MENEELNNLVDILHNKIYTECILSFEYKAASNDPFVGPPHLPMDNYSEDKIKAAILNNDDLNYLGKYNGEQCIFIDLNEYFEKVKEARKRKVEDLLEEIQLSNNDTLLFNNVYNFLDTHTYEERQLAKKIFLQKINVSIKKEEDIDNIFEQEITKFEKELLQRNHQENGNTKMM